MRDFINQVVKLVCPLPASIDAAGLLPPKRAQGWAFPSLPSFPDHHGRFSWVRLFYGREIYPGLTSSNFRLERTERVSGQKVAMLGSVIVMRNKTRAGNDPHELLYITGPFGRLICEVTV